MQHQVNSRACFHRLSNRCCYIIWLSLPPFTYNCVALAEQHLLLYFPLAFYPCSPMWTTLVTGTSLSSPTLLRRRPHRRLTSVSKLQCIVGTTIGRSQPLLYLFCSPALIFIFPPPSPPRDQQWLCYAQTSEQVAKTRLLRFFSSLYGTLKRGSRAALQFYPDSKEQAVLISSCAARQATPFFSVGCCEKVGGRYSRRRWVAGKLSCTWYLFIYLFFSTSFNIVAGPATPLNSFSLLATRCVVVQNQYSPLAANGLAIVSPVWSAMNTVDPCPLSPVQTQHSSSVFVLLVLFAIF